MPSWLPEDRGDGDDIASCVSPGQKDKRSVTFSQDERTILERGDLLPMAKARGITQDLVRELEPHGMTVWCLSSILCLHLLYASLLTLLYHVTSCPHPHIDRPS